MYVLHLMAHSVADWYDPGVGGHQAGDLTRGRIYRIAPPQTPYSVPKQDFTLLKEQPRHYKVLILRLATRLGSPIKNGKKLRKCIGFLLEK
jgi:hypothetical protein